MVVPQTTALTTWLRPPHTYCLNIITSINQYFDLVSLKLNKKKLRLNYMKNLRNTGIVGIITIGIGAIAFLTNPGEQKYQKYADTAIKNEFKDKVCTQVIEDLGVWLEGQCHLLIDVASPHLAQVVSQQTKRQNFLLFSIYQADLPLPAPFPKYHVETIGILGTFYTYQAKSF
jgi:hypothetical protein